MSTTPRLKLPLLSAGQAQASVTVDQALQLIDVLVQCTVLSVVLTTPPSSPSDGDAYVVPSGAIGSWSGEDNNLAVYLSGWCFVEPLTGFSAYSVADDATFVWNGSSWKRTGTSGGTFTLSAGGATSSTLSLPAVTATSQIILTPQDNNQPAAQFLQWIYPVSRVSGSPGSITFSHPANTSLTMNYFWSVPS